MRSLLHEFYHSIVHSVTLCLRRDLVFLRSGFGSWTMWASFLQIAFGRKCGICILKSMFDVLHTLLLSCRHETWDRGCTSGINPFVSCFKVWNFWTLTLRVYVFSRESQFPFFWKSLVNFNLQCLDLFAENLQKYTYFFSQIIRSFWRKTPCYEVQRFCSVRGRGCHRPTLYPVKRLLHLK